MNRLLYLIIDFYWLFFYHIPGCFFDVRYVKRSSGLQLLSKIGWILRKNCASTMSLKVPSWKISILEDPFLDYGHDSCSTKISSEYTNTNIIVHWTRLITNTIIQSSINNQKLRIMIRITSVVLQQKFNWLKR